MKASDVKAGEILSRGKWELLWSPAGYYLVRNTKGVTYYCFKNFQKALARFVEVSA